MYKNTKEAVELVSELKNLLSDVDDVEIVVCPPFTALYAVKNVISNSNINLGAQDMFWESEGAYTGEVSPLMLKDIGCKYVIIGHSERRQNFFETDETVNKKIKSAINHNLIPIVCVGEKLEQREKGQTFDVVKNQIKFALNGLDKSNVENMVIAYEPIWAIGTGRNATPEDANDVIKLIRNEIKEKFGDVSFNIRIQYGGSVKPENIKQFMEKEEIDGALVGGASLKTESFAKIVKFK
jgi:triosephosphate isomerase